MTDTVLAWVFDGAEAIIKLIAMAQRCGVRLDDEEIMSCMHIVAEHVGVTVMEELQYIDDLYFTAALWVRPDPKADVFFAWLPGDGFLTMNKRCLNRAIERHWDDLMDGATPGRRFGEDTREFDGWCIRRGRDTDRA